MKVSNAFRLWGRVGFYSGEDTEELSEASQTPFGFGGGLDRLNVVYLHEEVAEVSNAFRLGGGLDFTNDVDEFHSQNGRVSNAFRLWGRVGSADLLGILTLTISVSNAFRLWGRVG